MSEKIEVTLEQIYDIITRIDNKETSLAKEALKLGMERSTLGKKVKAYRDNPILEVAKSMEQQTVIGEGGTLVIEEQILNPNGLEADREAEILTLNGPITKVTEVTDGIEKVVAQVTIIPENEVKNILETAMDKASKQIQKGEKIAKEKAAVREEAEKADVEKITFTISKDLIRAIRMKAANEDIKIIDMVKDSFYDMIEPKYFKKI